jgi:hypothetical protein
MNLRFFGDSWYWSWYWQEFKSNAVKNKLVSSAGFPALEAYFNYLGVNCISYSQPGNSFSKTVSTVLNSNDHSDIQYNIVFFSSHLRRGAINDIDISSRDKFIEEFNLKTISELNKLQVWAKENKQQILLLGGQSTIHKHVFDKLPDSTNLHLVSECIISHLLDKGDPFGILKLATDITDLVDDTWDRDLVIFLYDNIKEWEFNVHKNKFTLPDLGHLNGSGALLLADIIMEKIEQLSKGENYESNSME